MWAERLLLSSRCFLVTQETARVVQMAAGGRWDSLDVFQRSESVLAEKLSA